MRRFIDSMWILIEVVFIANCIEGTVFPIYRAFMGIMAAMMLVACCMELKRTPTEGE